MNFGQALELLKNNKKVCRRGWNGKNMFLFLITDWRLEQFTNDIEGMELHPFIAMKTANETIVPWLASQTDVLSEDWEVVY